MPAYIWSENGRAGEGDLFRPRGTYAQMEGVAIVKGGPNKGCCGKIRRLHQSQGNVREMILAKTFRRPTRQDLDLAKLPGAMPDLATLKLLAYDEPKWNDARTPTMEKIKDIIVRTR